MHTRAPGMNRNPRDVMSIARTGRRPTTTFVSPKQLLDEKLNPVEANDESHKVGGHHQKHVQYSAHRADVSIPGVSLVLKPVILVDRRRSGGATHF